jgi:hypothetical protein
MKTFAIAIAGWAFLIMPAVGQTGIGGPHKTVNQVADQGHLRTRLFRCGAQLRHLWQLNCLAAIG